MFHPPPQRSSAGTAFSIRTFHHAPNQNTDYDEQEPLSLAEELAEEADQLKDEVDQRYEQIKQSGDTHIAELQRMSMAELIEEARKENLTDYAGAKKQDLIFKILKERVKLNGLMYGEGTLEVLPDGFGFLRSPDYHYLSCPDDIYVSPSQIRRFGLRTGTTVSGQIRPPKESERYFALLRVEAINYQDPNLLASKVFFDDLTPLHPDERIRMECGADGVECRVVDMIVPVGFGQRGLIVSPPRAGKTILMQKMAKAALANYPDLYVFMLLIDERRRITDMGGRSGKNCEVISSTFDEPAALQVWNGPGPNAGGIQLRRYLPGLDHLAGPGTPNARTPARSSPAASTTPSGGPNLLRRAAGRLMTIVATAWSIGKQNG